MSTLRTNFLETLSGIKKAIDKLVDNTTFVDRRNYPTTAEFDADKAGKLSVDGDKRARSALFIAGDEELVAPATRDAYVVGRNVVGLTDCHGFADRTVIDGVTDYGGYGSFDCTVKLDGSNNHDHVFSFQDRTSYRGSGALGNIAGFYSYPRLAGSGVIGSRRAVDIYDFSVTGAGTINEQIGVYVRDLQRAVLNVAVNVQQSSGYAIYAPGAGRNFFRGATRVGVDEASNIPFSVGVVGAPNAYINAIIGAGIFGVSGNSSLQLHNNAGARLEITGSASSYAVRPGADNGQPLGDATRRWSQVFAGTATISTSDAREKTEVRALGPNEIAAAKDLAKEIGAFRFLSAVSDKGESAREHIGMTVQRAIEVMQSHGLDPFAYSFICYDEWGDQFQEHPAEYEQIYTPETYDEDGNVLEEAKTEDGDLIHEAWSELVTPAGNRYSFRFEGLLAFIAAGFEARLSALESAE